MKHLVTYILVSIFGSCFSMVVLAQDVNPSQEKQFEKQPIASITMAIGDVFVKRQLEEKWSAVTIGEYIYQGDKLRTRENGKAEVTFLDASIVFLGHDTEMEFIEETENETKKNALFLFFGTMWNKVNDGSNYEVETIHALATVRGTYFNVKVDNEMEVWVKEGKVSIENEYGKVNAGKNTVTKVSKDKAPKKKRVKKSKFPQEIDLSSSIYSAVNVASKVNQEHWYSVAGYLKNSSNNRIINEQVVLSVRASEGLMLSQDKLAETDSLAINVEQGSFEFFIKSTSRKGSFTLLASDMQTETTYLTFDEPLTKKNVIVEFKDNENNLKKMNVLFEKK